MKGAGLPAQRRTILGKESHLISLPAMSIAFAVADNFLVVSQTERDLRLALEQLESKTPHAEIAAY